MSIRLGIYEIFSRIVPGGLYIIVILQILSTVGVMKFDWQEINNLSLAASIILIVAAYILGGAFDNLALLLFRLLKRPGFSRRSFAEFKQKHQQRWQIDFDDRDWPILLAFIRTKNLELAGELDRHNALSIMLRNVSLGLLFMAANGLIQFFTSGDPVNVFLSLAILILSTLILRESAKFRSFFYDGIYETLLAYRIDLETAIKPVPISDKRSKVRKAR